MLPPRHIRLVNILNLNYVLCLLSRRQRQQRQQRQQQHWTGRKQGKWLGKYFSNEQLNFHSATESNKLSPHSEGRISVGWVQVVSQKAPHLSHTPLSPADGSVGWFLMASPLAAELGSGFPFQNLNSQEKLENLLKCCTHTHSVSPRLEGKSVAERYKSTKVEALAWDRWQGLTLTSTPHSPTAHTPTHPAHTSNIIDLEM